MIVDFLEHDDGHEFRADLCVIGSGAAGITIAREFFNTNISVVILESGGRDWEHDTQALYDGTVVGLPHKGFTDGRGRVFGGTTTLWAGQTLPLNDMVFRDRPWVASSGWPITRNELEPFYRRAEDVLHLDQIEYQPDTWPGQSGEYPVFDSRLLSLQISQFSPKPNFAAAYLKKISAARNVTVVLHGNATEIIANREASAVTGVAIRSLSGRVGTARARFYLICCGGIESARLLLASDRVQSKGLGNRHDVVGRYFQDHAQTRLAPVKLNGEGSAAKCFEVFYRSGIAYSPRLVLSEPLQRQRQTLDAAVGINPIATPDENSPTEAAKRLFKGLVNRQFLKPPWPDLTRAISSPAQVSAALYRRFILGKSAFVMSGDYHAGFQSECEPNRESRVLLDEQRDALGMRKASLDWRLTPLLRHTARVAVETLDQELRRLGIGSVDLDSLELGSDDTVWQRSFWDVNHHIGTCRMSTDPAQGVVDHNCRVHGIENLFIGSSAVFPTGGYSNPTLTVIALAIRIADRLKVLLCDEACPY